MEKEKQQIKIGWGRKEKRRSVRTAANKEQSSSEVNMGRKKVASLANSSSRSSL